MSSRPRSSPSSTASTARCAGTGKTLTIAHILGRLSGCRRYLFVPAAVGELNLPERRFEDLVRTIGALARPAVVVVEDIDRLFQAGTVTPQYFLNVLDGMLRPGTPTLWIATCNDPSDLPENLTDRPGRFDRILVFEEPGPGERTELLRLYARTPLRRQQGTAKRYGRMLRGEAVGF